MRRFFVLCACLGLIAPITIGCQEKKKVETTVKKETPSGETTTTDSHETKTDNDKK